jgi:hypothetical protein
LSFVRVSLDGAALPKFLLYSAEVELVEVGRFKGIGVRHS